LEEQIDWTDPVAIKDLQPSAKKGTNLGDYLVTEEDSILKISYLPESTF